MKRISTIFISISLLLSINTCVLAQEYQNEGQLCQSPFTKLPAKIEYDTCTPQPLHVSQYGSNSTYIKYMSTGMDLAAEKGDWDSAMINFKKAYNSANNKGEQEEAERGYKGASLAKYLQNHPGSMDEANPYGGWVYVTGVRSSFD